MASDLSAADLRAAIYEEIHTRQPLELSPGDWCFHVVLLHQDFEDGQPNFGLVPLCEKFGIEPPIGNCRQFTAKDNDVQLKWELHTEFISITTVSSTNPNASKPINPNSCLPAEWLRENQSRILVACRIQHAKCQDRSSLFKPPKIFSDTTAAGSQVCDSLATIWTDFKVDQEGYSNTVLLDNGLGPRRAGRLVQRLLDIETYHAVALLGLQKANFVNQEINKIERQFHDLVRSGKFTGKSVPDEQLMDELLRIAGLSEELLSHTSFRFSASKAYGKIVLQRFAELNEERIQGAQRLSIMLKRRFLPAMETCSSTFDRLQDLIDRIHRDAALMRTHIDLFRQEQNTLILESMNKRVFLQFKLQKTVEALSVVAISYYAISIFSAGLKSMEAYGYSFSTSKITFFSIPIIVGLVAWIVSRRRRSLDRLDSQQISKQSENGRER